MLLPLTRESFEQLIPLIATGPQYAYYWGKPRDLLRRLLISFVTVIVLYFILSKILGEGGLPIVQLLSIVAGLYWLWNPIYLASVRNSRYRRLPYSGFLRGEILEVFVTDELIGEEETVNNRGELVIIENRERRINLEIGDESGFVAQVQSPLKRTHKALKAGQTAELLVLSKQPNLSRINDYTEAYIPSQDMWVGDYPYLQKTVFLQVRRELGGRDEAKDAIRRRATRVQRRRR